jgi:CRP-like cAMP-binding protein
MPDPFEVSPVLSRLLPDERSVLQRSAVPRRLDKGERLNVGGATQGRAYLIVRGLVKLVAQTRGGTEAEVAISLPGDLLGMLSALDEEPEPVSAVAAVPCQLIGLDAATLLASLRHNPQATLALTRSLVATMRWFIDSSVNRSFSDAGNRLVTSLIYLTRNIDADRSIPLSQLEIARLSGTCRESACRVIGQLKRDGVVSYDRSGLTIRMPDQLEGLNPAARVSKSFPSEDAGASLRSRSTPAA